MKGEEMMPRDSAKKGHDRIRRPIHFRCTASSPNKTLNLPWQIHMYPGML
ncbi:hypothetical protein GW17_00008120 [Ensete ventricosum]|nr:hypothetical protein GW17_00008120 [Ensete ventricosum]